MPMPPESSLSTAPVRLDLANERLWCGDQARVLRPKTFALLRYLVEHPEQLLTKATLLDALWPETAVSEVVLAVCMRELRRALGDDARTPRFIETVHRRGYRFIGHLPVMHPSALHTAAAPPPPLLVGRVQALDALHRSLATALTGVRQILFVTGEAGLGKTMLVDTFLATVVDQGRLWIGRGQCLDHYGAGEAYLPVLEALERLCRGPGGPEVVEILRHQAPTWMVQMPGLVSPAELEGLQRRVLGTTQERMLRELAEALNVLAAARPLVLVLEDLHWSDYATLDALVTLARRREPARLLLLGTYRPPDALQRGHPLHTAQHELHMHGQCAELSLTLLTEAAVADYLVVRFPDAQLPAGLARLVHQRTEGNPLFMVQVVEDWVRRGWLVQVDGHWTLQVGLAALAVTVPEGLRQMLEQHLDRLSPMEQQVLEVGSVAGTTFSAAAVAAGLDAEVVQVEEWCSNLARRRQWLQADGEQSWPDGTVAGAYRFTHALYQEVAYTSLSAARRVQLHCRIGEREEVGYGPQVHERAAELAVHFERGRDYQRAVQYHQRAADTALQRCAYAEVTTHLMQGLALLKTLPDTSERLQQELLLQTALGSVLIVTKGEAAADVEHAYARARELCQQVDDVSRLFTTLWGLRLCYVVRGELHTARQLGEQLLSLAQRVHDPRLLVGAHQGLGTVLFADGAFLLAQGHFQQGITLSRHLQRGHTSLYIRDPGVVCHAFAALTLWFLGYAEQALQCGHAVLTLAQGLADPFSLASVLFWTALFSHCCRDVQGVNERAEALIALATTHGFPHLAANGRVLHGWALSIQGHRAAALTQIHQGRAVYRATWAEHFPLHQLALLVEAYGNVGQADEGLRLLAEPWATDTKRGERYYAAELYRLQGELLLVQNGTRSQWAAEAAESFHQALAVAHRQQAKMLELRAAMRLSRLWQRQGKRAAAYGLLAPIYGWFTEGFDTADLQEAKALLEILGA
jgi:DNA-binding winged helix-turn-helix (wHTH) protein/predicted ATPase